MLRTPQETWALMESYRLSLVFDTDSEQWVCGQIDGFVDYQRGDLSASFGVAPGYGTTREEAVTDWLSKNIDVPRRFNLGLFQTRVYGDLHLSPRN